MSEGYRSLADQLRAWPDARLARLLELRSDLATPAPHDSSHLASRAATRSSVARALDQLTRLELAVLDALVVAGHTSAEQLLPHLAASPAAASEALGHLEDLVLVWQAPGGLRALTGVGEALVGGLEAGVSGLRSSSAEPASVADITARLAALSDTARAMLEHVDAAGGEATATARTTISPEEARTPAEELISRRLLVPRGGGLLVLPGEVGMQLRGGHTTREPVDAVPPIATSERSARLVDTSGAGAAFEAVRRVELLLDHWGDAAPQALRSGGLGVRDLKAAAALAQVGETEAALLVETAWAAGLVTTAADSRGNPSWIPTDAFDRWAEETPAERWRVLVAAWWDSPRMPSAVGTRDSAGKAWNALVPELHGPAVAESRHLALQALGELPAGAVLAAGTGLPSLVDRVAWLRPRRPRIRGQQVGWAIEEGSALGVLGLGGLTSYARRLLLDDEGPGAVTALDTLMPDPVDHVLLQADLTAVAPGPLESTLARRLQLVADVESRGGATVYRFTPTSVRRALDTGWTAVELHGFLDTVSRTPVPQPLTYLVDDMARTFGTVRVGHAEAFVRADDEAALAELLAHPRAAGLGLRRIAPTVLISSTPLDVLLPRLRDLGVAPAVEAEDGTLRILRPEARRARTPRERRAGAARAARGAVRVSQVVAAVRAGDRAADAAPRSSEPLTASGSLSALREALQEGSSVLIGYVDNEGSSSERVVDPLSVEGGTLVAHDHRSGGERRFAVHRIASVQPLTSGS